MHVGGTHSSVLPQVSSELNHASIWNGSALLFPPKGTEVWCTTTAVGNQSHVVNGEGLLQNCTISPNCQFRLGQWGACPKGSKSDIQTKRHLRSYFYFSDWLCETRSFLKLLLGEVMLCRISEQTFLTIPLNTWIFGLCFNPRLESVLRSSKLHYC